LSSDILSSGREMVMLLMFASIEKICECPARHPIADQAGRSWTRSVIFHAKYDLDLRQ
jgi:hypothetical protein